MSFMYVTCLLTLCVGASGSSLSLISGAIHDDEKDISRPSSRRNLRLAPNGAQKPLAPVLNNAQCSVAVITHHERRQGFENRSTRQHTNMQQIDTESSSVSNSPASSRPYRRLTTSAEFSHCASWCLKHRAWKLHAHINEFLAKGRISGDQGYSDDATPMLYVNSTSDDVLPAENFEIQVEVVLLFYGSGNIEAVLERARGTAPAQETQQMEHLDQRSLDEDWQDDDDTAFYVTFETTKSPASIRQLTIMLQELLPIHENFYFSGVSDVYDDVIVQQARNHRATLEWDRENEWCATAASLAAVTKPATGETGGSSHDAKALDCSSSSQFTIDSLRVEHVDLVVSNWDYASSSTPSLIRHLIENSQTSAVYHQGKPVSYCLQQQYGSIGMLYTEPEFRHRGLASKCVVAICAKILRSDPHQTLFAHISEGNTSSERVFSKLGFINSSKIRWIFWIPSYDTSSCIEEVHVESEDKNVASSSDASDNPEKRNF